MIEILFGESEGGAMKLAKNYQQPDYEDGPTAWMGEKPDKTTFEAMFAGEAVGGTSAEVIILPFMLDIGSLKEPLDSTVTSLIPCADSAMQSVCCGNMNAPYPWYVCRIM